MAYHIAFSAAILYVSAYIFVWILTTLSEQKLEKLEKEGLIEKPFQRKQLKIRFPERGRSGRTVLTIKNLQFGFEDKVSIVV